MVRIRLPPAESLRTGSPSRSKGCINGMAAMNDFIQYKHITLSHGELSALAGPSASPTVGRQT